jgi:hypothetical protein
MKTNFVYAIVDTSFLAKLDNIDINHLRFNKHKTKCIIKSYTEIPKLSGFPLYSKSQIKKILLNDDEWRNMS